MEDIMSPQDVIDFVRDNQVDRVYLANVVRDNAVQLAGGQRVNIPCKLLGIANGVADVLLRLGYQSKVNYTQGDYKEAPVISVDFWIELDTDTDT